MALEFAGVFSIIFQNKEDNKRVQVTVLPDSLLSEDKSKLSAQRRSSLIQSHASTNQN